MAKRIRGTIRKTNSRQWNGKTFHSINVDDVWYSVGLKKPPADGTLVEFEAEQNAKGYWDVTRAGLRVVQADAPTQNVASVAVAASGKGMSKDDYWTRKEERDIEKDKRIERQSCRNSALALIEILVKTESLKLPAAAKRVQFLEELVDHYTELFLAQNYNKKTDEKKNDDEQNEVSEEPNDDNATDQGDWDV